MPWDDDPSVGAVLQGWRGPAPRADFVDSVMNRVEVPHLEPEAKSAPPGNTARRFNVVVAAVSAAVGLVLGGVGAWQLGGGFASPGEPILVAGLATPEILVLPEAGASATWTRAGGAPVVHQHFGRVRYEVRAGAQLTVIARDTTTQLPTGCHVVEVSRSVWEVSVDVETTACPELKPPD